MRQLIYTMFTSNNRASFHFWWKENLLKHQGVWKYYEDDCSTSGGVVGIIGVVRDSSINVFISTKTKWGIYLWKHSIFKDINNFLPFTKKFTYVMFMLWLVSDFSSFLFSFLGFVDLSKLLTASTRITWSLTASSSVIVPLIRSPAIDYLVLNFWKWNILSFFVSSVL